MICSLEKLENEKQMMREIFASDLEKLPYKMNSVSGGNVYLDNVGINSLWDTGSMASVMNENFLQNIFQDVEIRSVEEVVGNNKLMVTVANQGELNFGVEKEQKLFQTPFLVIPILPQLP